MKKSIIVVLGMHRSGTSAVTRGLRVLGIDLGSNLVPPNFDNEKGFWEDEGIVRLNSELHALLGYDWFGTEVILPIDWSSEQIRQKLANATDLINNRIETETIFGFKDPRTAVLLEFWQKVFSICDLEPRYIISLRNPVAVADSLHKRNKLPYLRSLFLWNTSLISALESTIGSKRLVVSYENLLRNPSQELERIQRSLEIGVSKDKDLENEFIEEFLDFDLNHHDGKNTAISKLFKKQTPLVRLDRLALKLANDEVDFDSEHYRREFSAVLTGQQKAQPVFDLVFEQHSALLRSYRGLSEAQAQLQQKEEQLVSEYESSSSVKQELERIQHVLRELEVESEHARNTILDRETQIAGLNSDKQLLMDEYREKQRTCETLIRLEQALNTQLGQLEAEIGKLQEQKSEFEKYRDRERSLLAEKKYLLTELGEKKSLLRRAVEQIKDQAQVIQDSESSQLEMEGRLIQFEERSKELEVHLKDQAQVIQDSESSQLDMEGRLIQFEERSKELEVHLEDQAQVIQDSESSQLDMEGRLIQFEERSKELEVHSAGQAHELSRLRREVESYIENIESIGNSFSWKVTAPLRLLFDWLILYPKHVLGSLRSAKSVQATQLNRQHESTDFHKKNVEFIPCGIELINEEARERIFVARNEQISPPVQPARLLAFYLPQFHPIPENDEWWGEGFTEWTNVTGATPLYRLHYQPRVPSDLGYYDLRDVEVQRKQVELARQYGLGGFCFYFYWFHGERLLETPVLNYLENKDLDLPFCLCWANENWTRTWDGKDSDILIGQDHSDDDDIAFIEYLSKYLNDARYIRVAGKPLILVYRPSLLPDAAKTAGRWRKWCQNNGVGEIYLAYTQSFEKVDPADIGFDAAIEFPPNNTGPEIITDQVDDLPFSFKGFVYDWTSIASRSETYMTPEYTLFRGVNPCWDNTARRRDTGAVFTGNTPSRYQKWLENAITDTQKRFDEESERLVFINAWNEWAEGAYLEPDAAHGYAYLQATKNALENSSSGQSQPKVIDRKIILVAHDGHPHGAQYLMLYTARCLNQYFGFKVDLVVLGEGILIDEFKKWAMVHSLVGLDNRGNEAKALALMLAGQGHTAAICNTTVSGLFLETLSNAGLRTVSLVHELSNVITDNQLEEHARSIAKNADKVVFAATQVREPFLDIAPISEEKTVIRFQGNYKNNAYLGKKDLARRLLRKKLGLPPESRVVLGAGYLDYRKGIDLFVKAALEVCNQLPEARFVWIGHWEINMEKQVRSMLEDSPLCHRIIFPGRQDDTDLFFAGADIFALTSREDPFPTTVMEALEVSTPVVGFAGAGGSENLIQEGCGLIVPMEDVGALIASLAELIGNHSLAEDMGENGAHIVRESFSFPHYMFDLLELAGKPIPRVSAIVPNYNYERHIEQRLRSIFEQVFPIYELIVLDDASSDSSVELIKRLLNESAIHSRLIVNEINSGSVFRQWEKGVNLASGELVWICEADDYADPELVESAVGKMREDSVVLSYTQSSQIDDHGAILERTYLDYTNDVCVSRWCDDYVADGTDELENAMCIKNTIPNVSAVIFRTEKISKALKAQMPILRELKIAGDWLVYSELLREGKVAFTAKPLNFHRRHDKSVTINKDNNEKHMSEILFLQSYLAKKIKLSPISQQKAKNFAVNAFHYLKLDDSKSEDPHQIPSIKHHLSNLEALIER